MSPVKRRMWLAVVDEDTSLEGKRLSLVMFAISVALPMVLPCWLVDVSLYRIDELRGTVGRLVVLEGRSEGSGARDSCLYPRFVFTGMFVMSTAKVRWLRLVEYALVFW